MPISMNMCLVVSNT